jgi:predicted dehydrogenase
LTPIEVDHQSKSRTVAVGMLGYSFMGKAHCNAFRTLSYMTWPAPALPRLRAVCGRDATAVREAAERYGFEAYCTDWRELVADPEIEVFDNTGPNDVHAEPCIEAARAGKHVLCEKPLGRSAEEAKTMLEAVEEAGVQGMVGFNYRFVPALRLARELIASGRLGAIHHFRGRYLQDWIVDPEHPFVWRLDAEAAGSGALGDIGAHVVDLARWLVGEIGSVCAVAKTFVPERPFGDATPGRGKVTVDDAAVAVLEFADGAIGSIEATRFAAGRKNHLAIEVNGSAGSLVFDLERLNELEFYSVEGPPDVRGFADVLVTEADHPFYSFWWPPGHTIGWEHSFVHEVHHFLRVVAHGGNVGPEGATFRDGYLNALVLDAVVESSRSKRTIDVGHG